MLTKTTLNFASKRGLELDVNEETIYVYLADSDEPEFALLASDNGFFFKANISLPQDVKEELPHWIQDEKKLREVLDFVAKEVA